MGFDGGDPISNDELLTLDVDVLVPAAVEHVLHAGNAADVKARWVIEGANGPTTGEADAMLTERGVTVVPDILANAGGVVVSYFEWVQAQQAYWWTEAEIEQKLADRMAHAYAAGLRDGAARARVAARRCPAAQRATGGRGPPDPGAVPVAATPRAPAARVRSRGEHRRAPRRTYLLVDGENIDATLGGSILGARPAPEQRPRWERVLDHARAAWGADDVRGLFFLNASNGTLPMAFVQALLAIGFQPVPAVVGATRTSRWSTSASSAPSRRSPTGPATCCWPATTGTSPRSSARWWARAGSACWPSPSSISSALRALTDRGLEVFDLEHDVHAFTVRLPRVRIIPLEEFDPTAYL